MTLNEWFKFKTKWPMAVFVTTFLTVLLIFTYYTIYSDLQHQDRSLKELIVSPTTMGIQQNNRELIDSVFPRSLNLGATKAFLCSKNNVVQSVGSEILDCSKLPTPRWYEQKVTFKVVGFEEYSIFFYRPIIGEKITFFWLLLFAVVILFSFFLLERIKNSFTKDILGPLESKLLSEGETPIVEFEKIRRKIKSITKSHEDRAFANAILESKLKFAHNSQSCIRNIKTLRKRTSSKLNKEERVIFDSVINQLREMANKLVVKNAYGDKIGGNVNLSLVELQDVVLDAIERKRFEGSSDKSNVEINFTPSQSEHISIVEVDQIELKSVFSNLFNNSFQANATIIDVSSICHGSSINILVKDNGVGIPKDILPQLFKRGATFGKESGSGYGLFHARKYLQEWGGNIEILSSNSNGTLIQVSIPLYHVKPVSLTPSEFIVIMDDSEGERERLKSHILNLGIKNKILEFQSGEAFSEWFRKKRRCSKFLFFADNILGSEKETGFEIVNKFKLQENSFLYTDSHEDTDLYAKCNSIGLSVIPKLSLNQITFDPSLVH